MKILVMSCDKNEDLFIPFYLCMEKYWTNHPEIIYCCEKIKNPFYRTINVNYPLEKWTKRVYECVKQIDDDYILLTVDDLFIRERVNNERIMKLTRLLVDNVASINLEFSFDSLDVPYVNGILIRNNKGKFKLSCMCQIWRKSALLDLFNVELDPWSFEKNNESKNYDFFISERGDFINWGKRRDTWKWGVVRNKWTKECKDFFDKECIFLDYSKRGFWE